MIEAIIPYIVSYAPRVRQAFAEMVKTTTDAELATQIREAAREIDYRLHIYPQFGDPIRDLSLPNVRQWQGIVNLLAAGARRTVIISHRSSLSNLAWMKLLVRCIRAKRT